MLIFYDSNAKDILPGNTICYLVFCSILVDDLILELCHVGKPSGLLWGNALLVLDVGDSSVVCDQGKGD